MQSENKVNSLLITIFVVLIVIVSGLIGYYLYISKSKESTTNAQKTVSPSFSPAPVYVGIIMDLDVIKQDNIAFSYVIDAGDGKNIESHFFYFAEHELSNMKVTDSSGKPLTYKDLQTKQRVRVGNGGLDIQILE